MRILTKQNCLPITDPNYLYPDSPNPYFEKVKKYKNKIFVNNECEKNKGQWRSLFPSHSQHNNPQLHLEIGCNGGHVILEWAKKNPNNFYIGLDWKFKQIFRAQEKAIKHKINNIVFIRAHAERIQYMFNPGELDSINVFFPDPWEKKSQQKNRYLHKNWMNEIQPLLKPEGDFNLRTDHRGYFDFIEDNFNQHQNNLKTKWDVLELTKNLYENHPEPEKLEIPQVTLFEKLFIRDQIPINSLKLKKPKE
mgnify:CR=1 FL=1